MTSLFEITHDIVALINEKPDINAQKEVIETLHRMVWSMMNRIVNHDGGDRRVCIPEMNKSSRTEKLELEVS